MQTVPKLGLGTWKIGKDVVEDIVYNAIKTHGVRHIDCACDYGNEVEVGRGINKAINEGIVSREELWITSKLWNTFHRQEHVELACKKSLTDLGVGYLDLYMVHFPISMKYVPIETRYPPEWIHDPSVADPKIELDLQAPMHLTWAGMEGVVGLGLAKHIGICNFNVQLTMDLLSYAKIPPYMIQLELHPYLQQQELIDMCISRGIRVTAFSPLGSPSYVELGMDFGLGIGLLENDTVTSIAAAHKKSAAQVLLRWSIQRGCCVIPKSCKNERVAENANIFDFELTAAEMDEIKLLDKKGAVRFNDPGVFCAFMGGAIPIYR